MFNKFAKVAVLTFVTLLYTSFLSLAQEEQVTMGPGGFFQKLQIKPIIDFQLWATYTHGTRIADTVPGQFIGVDDRVNFVMRRGRFGFTAHPHERLFISTIAQIDFVGRDVFAGYPGGANNTTFPEVGLWDLRVTWRATRNSEKLYLTTGYFAPQFSREHLTPWHFVSSLAKAYSQTYIRRHMTGRGPGRSLGINAGGLNQIGEKIWIKYDLGVYNPVFTPSLINTSGQQSSVMAAGRFSLQFGQPEWGKYDHMLSNPNAISGRQGVSIGISGTVQGHNDIFNSSNGVAFDFLINKGQWHMEGDYAYLWRTGDRVLSDGSTREINYGYTTGFVRTGYNFPIANEQIIEPAITYIRFDGSKTLVEQEDAAALLSPSGSTWSFDAGVNWYVVRNKVKLSLHYTFQGADAGEAGPGKALNELIVQSGTRIQRGDWLGAGLVLRL